MTIEFIIGMALGLLIGVGVPWLVNRQRQSITDQMQSVFAQLAQEALQTNNQQGAQNLTNIATNITTHLTNLQQAVQQSNTSQQVLNAQITAATQETNNLRQTTEQISNALANPQHRGQWGERMAEDVLRLADFIEGVNYFKQQTGDNNTRPDFTFPLPNDLILNMDVKFPFINYQRYLNAESEDDKSNFGEKFIGDVNNHVQQVATRDYIDPPTTVNYALLFIPNEQVYSTIHDLDPLMIDRALERHIVLCSPLTLYAMLAVIRQAAENVQMERRAFEMADLISKFMKQWNNYKEELNKLGGQIQTVSRTYDRLQTTRTNQLERPINKINDLREARGELSNDDEQQKDDGNQ